MENQSCFNCTEQYGVHCEESERGGRDIRGRLNFHGVHTINDSNGGSYLNICNLPYGCLLYS